MPRIFFLHIFVLMESFVTLLLSLIVLKKYKTEQCQPEAEETSTSGVWNMRKGRVSPVRKEKDNAKKLNTVNLTAKTLDTIFFAVVLTGNTIGIAIILAVLV